MSRIFEPTNQSNTFDAIVELIGILRKPDGCPWDAKQTHKSLKQMLLEECYETLEAIDSEDPQKLLEELGDLLVHIAFHIQIAEETNQFNSNNVMEFVTKKLLRRHPHVFGNTKVKNDKDVKVQWDKIKQKEKGTTSPIDSIPTTLPALLQAQLIRDRVSRDGFDWEEVSGVLDKINEEINELKNAKDSTERIQEMGDVLFSLVNLCSWLEIQAEDALRQSNARFTERYNLMRQISSQSGKDFASLSAKAKELLWQEAKKTINDST